MTRIGNRDCRAKVNSVSASNRANVRPWGLSAVSTADWMICWTRINPVTAAIVVEGPMRSSHSCAARAIGSNGNGPFMRLEVSSDPRQAEDGDGVMSPKPV